MGHLVSRSRAPALSVIRNIPVSGKKVSVTVAPSMTQFAVRGLAVSTFASVGVCN